MITELKMSRARRNRAAWRTSAAFVGLAIATLLIAVLVTLPV